MAKKAIKKTITKQVTENIAVPVIVELKDITFKSVYASEFFKVDGIQYRFKDFVLTVPKCTERLKAEILKRFTIKEV